MTELIVTKLDTAIDSNTHQITVDAAQEAREKLWVSLESMANYLQKWKNHIDGPRNITTQEAKTIKLTLEKVLQTYTQRILNDAFDLFIAIDNNVDS